MNFEFDARKSDINRQKHGVDFVEAQALWDDPDLLEIPAKTIDERTKILGGWKNCGDTLVRYYYLPCREY